MLAFYTYWIEKGMVRTTGEVICLRCLYTTRLPCGPYDSSRCRCRLYTMKRLGRWLFNSLAALSLGLCILAICLWCSGPWDIFFNSFDLGSGDGEIGIFAYSRPNNFPLIVSCPYWLLIFELLIAPSLWTFRWRRRHLANNRITQNLCLHCGYDLRATPSRCPECGNVPQKIPVVSS
jgi:hypothetical protein